MFEEYIFAIIFGILSWASSLQFAKLLPHNVKYGKYVLYLHSLLCILGIYEVFLSLFEPTQAHSIPNSIHTNNRNIKILLTFSIPAHFELFITNFIIFQWIKIYFSVGVTEGSLVYYKWIMVFLSILSFIALLISVTIIFFDEYAHLVDIIYTTLMYIVGSYCLLMSISFISVACLLMRRVLQTSNMSGITADKSVCRRLLGSGIILCASYFIQGSIIICVGYHSVFISYIRWIVIAFKLCMIMIYLNTLLLYSKIIQQRLKTHWRKWAKSNRMWDLNTSTKKRRKNKRIHIRGDTEEIPFDPADIRLIRALTIGSQLNSNFISHVSSVDGNVSNTNTIPVTNMNRKATQKFDKSIFPPQLNSSNGWTSINNLNDIMTDNENVGEQKDTNNQTNNEDEMIGFDTMDKLFDEFVLDTDDESNDIGNIENVENEQSFNSGQYMGNESMNKCDIMSEDEYITNDNKPDLMQSAHSHQFSGDSVLKTNHSQHTHNSALSDIKAEEILVDLFENGLHSSSPKQITNDNMNQFQFPMTNYDSATKISINNEYNESSILSKNSKESSVLQRNSLKVTHFEHDSLSSNTIYNDTQIRSSLKSFTQLSVVQNTGNNSSHDDEKYSSKIPQMFKSKSMQNTTPNSKQKNKSHKTFNSSECDEHDALIGDQLTDQISKKSKKTKKQKHSPNKKKVRGKLIGDTEEYSYLTQPKQTKSANVSQVNSSESDSDQNGMEIYSTTEDEKDIHFEPAYLTTPVQPKSPKSIHSDTRNIKKKKGLPLNRALSAFTQNHKISSSIIDMDYRKSNEYKNIRNDTDIINGSVNPRFWKYLRKKHSKQIKQKALNKFTFSFEKARYEPLLSREHSSITPCSSPRYYTRKINSKNESNSTSLVNQTHLRSTSDQSGKSVTGSKHVHITPAKQQNAYLKTIEGTGHDLNDEETKLNVSDTLKVTTAIDIDSNQKSKFGFSISRSPTRTKSPFNFSTTRSKSKSPLTPEPQNVNIKKKELLPFPKPLTPLSLSSKFKKAQQTFFGGHKTDIINSTIATELSMRKEYNKLDKKRKNLEMISNKRELDISGVAAKLDYWKSNIDPKWKNINRAIKTARVVNKNKLQAREDLRLVTFNSDPMNINMGGNKNKMNHKWKNMFGRSGNHGNDGIIQHQTLQVQHSPYLSGFDMDISDSSSGAGSTTSSSSSGKYSNSNDNDNIIYDSNVNKSKSKKRKNVKYKKKNKNKRIRNKHKSSLFSAQNNDMLNSIRYNKPPVFSTDATDSDNTDNEIETNLGTSSLKSFKKLKTISKSNPGKYIRAKSMTPRTPTEHNKKMSNNKLNQSEENEPEKRKLNYENLTEIE